MRDNHGTTIAAVAATLALVLGAFGGFSTPAEAAAAPVETSRSTATISSNPVNGTDYTPGYYSGIRSQDSSLVHSGVENPAPGATGDLVEGQFGWVSGTGKHELSLTDSRANGISQLRITPGVGWFWSIDRQNPGDPDDQVDDTDIHTDNPTSLHDATLARTDGEHLTVTVTWTGTGTCPASFSHDIWAGPRTGLRLGVHGQKAQTHNDNMNTVNEAPKMRHDRLVVLVDGHNPLTNCAATINYAFNLKFVFETGFTTPIDMAHPDNVDFQALGGQQQEMRVWVVKHGTMAATPTAAQKSVVAYAPVILADWVCDQLAGEEIEPEECAAQSMEDARTDGPRRVVFADPDDGWYTLVMTVTAAGTVQGAMTYVPDPYVSYTTQRTKLLTFDNLGYLYVNEWPYAPMATY